MQTASNRVVQRDSWSKEKRREYYRAWCARPENKAKRKSEEGKEMARRASAAWRAKPANLAHKHAYESARILTPEQKARKRERQRAYCATPEGKARIRATYIEYSSRPEIKAKIKARNKRQAKTSPQLNRSRKAARRAKIKHAEVGDRRVIAAWEKRYRTKVKVVCYWCRGRFVGVECHTDHVVALSRGGRHSIENLCISCPDCNLSKHAKALDDWNRSLVQPVLL